MPDDIRDVHQHVPVLAERSSRSSSHRRSKTVPIGKGPAIQKGTYSAYGAFRALLFGPPSVSRPPSSSQPETSPLQGARCSNNYLSILIIFVKQRTYLIIFVKQRTYLIILMKQRTYLTTLPDRPPGSGEFEKDET
jgi:hypothetical protein